MSSKVSHSVLQRAALASGLLSSQQLEDALTGLVESSGGQLKIGQVTDEELGQRLVEVGYLNRWQVEQLREGRTKFTLGPYRIVNAIGQGGMGHVFKAEHTLLGRIEAIKVLPKSKSTPEAVAGFQHEIRAHAQLDHPNLVRVSYADYEGDTYFFVTEFVPGTDLRKLVRRNGPLPASIAATIVSQAAEGLHYAHRKGLVHRDVKPGNLLVTPEGHTKLTDLGLAWFIMEDLGDVGGKSRTLVGTADYLAPESINEPSKIRPVSDVYSLGCTLYYAVTGKVPFPGGNTTDKMRRHLEETPLNPLHFNPDLPEEFCDVIAAMMNKDLNQRTPTAAAVIDLLLPFCDERATQDLAQATPPPSGIFSRANLPVVKPASSEALDETTSFVLDDWDSVPGQVDSPSQISQGTLSLASDSEDTLTHTPTLPEQQSELSSDLLPPAPRDPLWPKLAIAIALMAVGAALAVLLARYF